MIMGFVFTSRFQLLYRLDKKGILLRVGEFESNLNRMAWIISRFVQSRGGNSSRFFVLMKEELYIPWDKIYRTSYDHRRRIVSLIRDQRSVMRVFCTPTNVDLVFEAIKGYLPEPKT